MQKHKHCDCCDGCKSAHVHEHEEAGCGCGHAHGEHDAYAPLRVAVGAAFLVAALFTGEWQAVQWGLCVAATVVTIYPVVIEAWEELSARSLGENVLLCIAVVAAFAIGEGVEGATVAVLFSLGELLEDAAVGRSRREIGRLSEIRPDTIWRRNEAGELEELPAEQAQVGDVLEIPPHRRVAVDCEVLDGNSEADTSALTGESVPMEVKAGSTLLSGSVNGSGTLTVRVLRPAEQSASARILQMVTDASARKGRSEKFITRFARIYTPLVTAAAVVVAVVPSLLGLTEWSDSIHRSLTFLVAACPCALVISVPLGFTAGMGAASRNGVLIKGGRFVEELANVRAVAMDKTGTLTTGRLQVTRLQTAAGADRGEILSLAYALERDLEHPLAQAIVAFCEQEGVAPAPIAQRRELSGRGVTAVFDGKTVWCGSARLMAEERIALETDDTAASIWLAADGKAIAAFTMDSEVREDAAQTVSELRSLGVQTVAMLTGDAEKAAREVGRKVGIDEIYAALLPEDKCEKLATLREKGSTAFVGDGINDAPSLAAADTGIAMGLGSGAALEAGDVVLMGNRLSQLPTAIRLCRRVMRVVRFNIVFALTIKAAVLIPAVFGLAPTWAAVFADVGVSCLAVLNSARLLLTKREKKSTL